MKKHFTLFVFMMVIMFHVNAQTKIGIKLSPLLSVNRVSSSDNNINASSDGVGVKMSFGPIFDIYLHENYYFSTGLLYTPKRAGIAINSTDSNLTGSQNYKLQYLQIPATLKMFTNELALDTRVYFQIGVVPEIKIDEKGTSSSTYVRKFRAVDFSVLAGFGVEHRLGISSSIFAGLSYSRGLVNAASKRFDNHNFKLKNDIVSLDLGIKF